MSEEDTRSGLNFTELAAEIVSAYVSNNPVPPAELPALIARVHAAVSGLTSAGGSERCQLQTLRSRSRAPAQIRKSVRDDGIVSFIDGKSL